ncbi:peptidyl-prolyl cis-trans isomerase [Winogradskyella immobilis]|uniref:peptidyl-prolyl cis-trans isomerase n=1 Tax=Winogradskyella immobilis TaxID=2816852 RepID=UPI002035F6A4|nr:peptidyl-prolyl cis-trans isomerase [Winogradskyella immobilis]
MKNLVIIILILTVFTSCNFYKNEAKENAIARVGDNYLYTSDLNGVIPENASKTDSAIIANSYINRWASALLLMDKAQVNLPVSQQNNFEDLVSQYKNDLYTNAYLEALVTKTIDTLVGDSEAKLFYEKNKESFKLNDDLIKFRYVNIPQNAVNIEEIEDRFKSFEYKDKMFLDSISVQFKTYSLNDSTWIKANQVIVKVPVITQKNKQELLKKSNFIRLKDSLNLYLIQINEVLSQNDYAPLDYVKPSINQIVINKRKLELIKELENDITKDAIKNKQFEIYD